MGITGVAKYLLKCYCCLPLNVAVLSPRISHVYHLQSVDAGLSCVRQVLVCGGSPCITPVRLTLQLVLGLAQAVLVCCLSPADRLLPAAVGGYLLSTDTGQQQSQRQPQILSVTITLRS